MNTFEGKAAAGKEIQIMSCIIMENNMPKTGERNNTLQILRGLAIAVVLLHHAISKIGGGAVLQGIDNILICFHMPAFLLYPDIYTKPSLTNMLKQVK